MIYTLIFYVFTAQGQVLSEQKLQAFTDAQVCASFIPDVQNIMVASMPEKARKAVIKGEIAARAVCQQALSM